jgi:hypothetical protein
MSADRIIESGSPGQCRRRWNSLGQRPQTQELCVERLGVLLGLDAGASDRALDHLDVEPDFLLERADLSLRSSTQLLLRVADHRVVHAADDAGDAHDALQIDFHDVEWRRIVAMRLGELQRELVGERRLPRVARPEQRHVRPPFQR